MPMEFSELTSGAQCAQASPCVYVNERRIWQQHHQKLLNAPPRWSSACLSLYLASRFVHYSLRVCLNTWIGRCDSRGWITTKFMTCWGLAFITGMGISYLSQQPFTLRQGRRERWTWALSNICFLMSNARRGSKHNTSTRDSRRNICP